MCRMQSQWPQIGKIENDTYFFIKVDLPTAFTRRLVLILRLQIPPTEKTVSMSRKQVF